MLFRILLTLCLLFNYSPGLLAQGNSLLSFDFFSQADGLPNNQIQCIYQDKKGWIWIGTSQGLSRFDGYNFVNFLQNPQDTSTLKGNLVRVIFEDNNGNLMIGTENGGLNIFDRDKEHFLHPYKDHPEFNSREVSVNAITGDKNGNIYFGTDRSLLMADAKGKLERVDPVPGPQSPGHFSEFIRVIQFDNSGNLWIGTNNGLFMYNPASNSIETIPLAMKNEQSREIYEIFKDTDGLLWIGTYSNGLYITDPVTKSAQHLDLDPTFDRTETIRTISKGILGDYWIGTRGGLYVYSRTRGVTGFIKHDDRDSKSLANNSIIDIFHDSRGETWIGTRGGLNLLAKSKQVFLSFSALPNDNHYLNSSIIYDFWIDDTGKIWVGTEDGGINIYDPDKGTFEYLMAGNDKNSLSENCIKAFLDDKKGNLWIGTYLGGIDVLNLRTQEITRYQHSPDDIRSLSDNRVWALCLDDDGGIWVGTSEGVDRFDPDTKEFIHYPRLTKDFPQNKQVRWVSIDSDKNIWLGVGTPDGIVIYDRAGDNITSFNEHSMSFFEDSKKRYWIATQDKGIALYSKSQGALRYYDEDDGLSNNQALCILEDNSGYLWISTSNGLSKFDPDNEQFRNFTSRDGLSNNQFTYGAAYKGKGDELLFGGISGFNMFNPRDLLSENSNVPMVFTDLKIFNKKVPIEDRKDAILQKSISVTSHITLSYDQNVFTLEFAALDFINSTNNLYSYFLEGFDKGWNEPSSSRTITYTNLNPDDYTLRIKRILPGMQTDSDELQLSITVLPPFWMTWWFRAFLIMVIIALGYNLIRFIINREKIRHELALEKIKARDLHEIDMLKLRFFTNISHEIRTPLTLILGPLEKLISKEIPSEEVDSHLNLVYRNTRHLNRLVNQLLDFRKMETGNLALHLAQNDMVDLISNVMKSFEDFASEKQIDLRFHSLKKKLISKFDTDKVETILNNLISNALKYTDPGGKVSVSLSLVFAPDEEESLDEQPDKQYIEISVRDTGRGIPEPNIAKVFNRFFRGEIKDEITGTGIGLALVKEMVKLHRGNISLISKPGKGSKFTVRLPFEPEENQHHPEIADGSEGDEILSFAGNGKDHDQVKEPNANIMLIVEDNPDLRFFIRSHFETVFTVFEAKNGKDGWDKTINLIPDIIICDILMPDVDGYELCKRVKKDERTSHIPVLLVTALHAKDHEIEGLTCGADDYITKPFDLSILQTKIENILQVRRLLKEKYTKEIILKPTDITISSPDERFLRRAIEVVEKNISNPDLDIEQFAIEVGVSRMQLYRKFNALTNMTVKEFIRSIRLKRAAQILLEDKLGVAEIAYSVGFRDLAHFRKCFNREYGMSPSKYAGHEPVNAPD